MSQLITSAGGAPAPAQPAAENPHLPQSRPDAPSNQLDAGIEKPAPVDLGSLIKMEREAREAARQRETHAKGLEAELQKARAEIEAMRKAGEFEDDPISFGKSRGWTREQQLFFGQALLYDIVPDQAPPEFRQQMFEQRMTRKERELEKQRQEAEAQARQHQETESLNQYAMTLDQAVESCYEGSYPESTAWFGEDRQTFVRSLLHTAQNLAAEAAAESKVADLRPANVARVLEAEVARKMAERDRRASARKGAVAPQGPSGVQSAEAMSTRNMNGYGTPRPPATDDAERVRRAAEVAFRSRP
jgi:hypothetical protein